MIRTIVMLLFWALAMPVASLIGFPWTFITGDIRLLYRLFNWGAYAGVWLTGVRVKIIGLDRFDHSRSYIFMTNHVSNLDPPIQIPLIPQSYLRDGEKRTVQGPYSWLCHETSAIGSSRSWQPRCRYRCGSGCKSRGAGGAQHDDLH